MCGIFGYVTADPDVGDAECLARAAQALGHRGPDDQGTFEGAAGDVRCGMAHTRLAILDLSQAGHQPMSTEEGRFTIVYNGEIYNHQEIRRDLERSGERFRSSCDTEVVLRAYARWGPRSVRRLRGMFAFGIWDAVEGALFLARDQFGIKPLYYASSPRGLAFASEVRALSSTRFASSRLSRRAVHGYLLFGSVQDPGTILEGVEALPAGSWLLARRGAVQRERYRPLAPVIEPQMTFAQAAAGIRPVLRDAVQLQLCADVPLGVFLSGGIDSSVVVALAAEASSAPVHTVTVTFDESAYVEAHHAREVARRFGCNHHEVLMSARTLVRDIDAAIGALDQPSSDGLNTYFVSKAAREAGLKVVLTGIGGDELFAGYGHFRSIGPLLAALRAARLARPLGRIAAARLESLAGVPNRAQKLGALLATDGSLRSTYAVLRGMFTETQCKRLLGHEPPEGASWAAGDWLDVPGWAEDDAVDPVNAYAAIELQNYLRNTLLRDTDAMSMAHSIEVRVPLLDHVLATQVLGVPGRLKLSRSQNKPLLTSAAPALPPTIVRRPKMGFTLPLASWFRGDLRPWMEDALLGPAARRLGLFDPAAVRATWSAFLKGERYVSYSRVWCLAALNAWCRHNGVTA